MICTIEWNGLTPAEWHKKFALIQRSSVLQSYAYAKSQFIEKKQKIKLGLIKVDGKEAGLVLALEAGVLKNLIHAVIVDRGPLWFKGFGSMAHQKAFAQALNDQFPKRFGRRRRFIPEMPDSPAVREMLSECGFTRSNAGTYETLWLDLRADEDTLRAGLKKNWRGALNKAERANLSVEWDDTGKFLPWLAKEYNLDKRIKNYTGPSLALLKAMAQSFVPEKTMVIGRALMNDKPIAAILLLCHGGAATYQIGWSSDTGRDHAAHHLLLWQALRILKNKGINDFDLGGVNEDEAKGIKHFKSGMGGTLVALPGLYH